MKSVNHSVCIYLFVLTYFVLTYFVPKMIVKIGKRPGRIHCKKRCDISVFNGTMAHGACLSRSLFPYSIGACLREILLYFCLEDAFLKISIFLQVLFFLCIMFSYCLCLTAGCQIAPFILMVLLCLNDLFFIIRGGKN